MMIQTTERSTKTNIFNLTGMLFKVQGQQF